MCPGITHASAWGVIIGRGCETVVRARNLFVLMKFFIGNGDTVAREKPTGFAHEKDGKEAGRR